MYSNIYMSATLDIPFTRVLDNRLAQNPENKMMSVSTPGSQVTPRVESSTSGSGNLSNISFNLTPNSPANVIGRDFIVAVDVELAFTGQSLNASTPPLLKQHCDAPRALSSCIQSTNLTINGLTISQETSETYHAFQHFNQSDEMVKFQTLNPGLMSPDYTQTYEDVFGTEMNPLAGYNDSTRARFGRGCYPFKIRENTPTTAKIVYTLYELLTLSPLVFDSGLYPGLCNVNSMQLQLTLQNLSRLWSHNSGRYSDPVSFQGAGTQINSVAVQFSKARVYFTEITPPVYLTIPPVCSLSYYDIQRQTSSLGISLKAGQDAIFNSNSYQLNTVPSRIIVYVKERSSNITANVQKATETPDCYARITSISIQYNNNSSLMSQADISQLYAISSRNGVDMAFHEFYGSCSKINPAGLPASNPPGELFDIGTTGSIVCLDLGRDVTSDPTALAGTSVNANISIQVNATNPRTRAWSMQSLDDTEIVYDLTVLYVYAGLVIISPGSCYKYSTLLTREQVLSIPLVEGNSSKSLTGGDASSFFGTLKSGIQKPWNVGIGKVQSGSTVEGSGSAVPSDTKMVGGMKKKKGGNIYTGGGVVDKKTLKDRHPQK